MQRTLRGKHHSPSIPGLAGTFQVLRLLLTTALVATSTLGCAAFTKSSNTPPASTSATDVQRVSRPALARPEGLAILQGLTNTHATQISIVVPFDKSLRVQFSDLTTMKPLTDVVEIQHSIPNSRTSVRQFLIRRLNPKNTYQLTVLEENGREIDSRRFRSLDISRKTVTFAAASCMSDYFLEHQSGMWSSLRESKPDFLILLGDNNYAAIINSVNRGPLPLHTLWERYAESAMKLDLYHFPELLPTVAIWLDVRFPEFKSSAELGSIPDCANANSEEANAVETNAAARAIAFRRQGKTVAGFFARFSITVSSGFQARNLTRPPPGFHRKT